MPTYEYECKECGGRVDIFQSMSENPKRKCPLCGARSGLKRLIGCGAGIIFRGSGFYQTDYRSADYKKRAKKDKEAAGGSTDGKQGKKGSEKKKEACSTSSAASES